MFWGKLSWNALVNKITKYLHLKSETWAGEKGHYELEWITV